MFYDKDGNERLPRAYLAGTEIFMPNRTELGDWMRGCALRYGIEGFYPPDAPPDDEYPEYEPKDDSKEEKRKRGLWHDLNHDRRSDMIIANLNDWRGWEPDSGTVFEIGYAYALGKRLYGFMDDARPMLERYTGYKTEREKDGRWVDGWGCTIEDFDMPVNVMLGACMTIVEGNFEDCCKRVKEDLDKERAELEAKK